MQLQRGLVAVVLDILAAVQRVRDQFLKHLSGELSVLDVKREVRLGDRSDVDLRGQIVLHDGFRRVFDGLELALDKSRRESSVSVDVDFINVILSVPQQS